MAKTRTASTIEVNGYAVRAIRMHAGLTVAAIAAAAGMTTGSLRNIEIGRRPRMSPGAFNALCRALALQDHRAILAHPQGIPALAEQAS